MTKNSLHHQVGIFTSYGPLKASASQTLFPRTPSTIFAEFRPSRKFGSARGVDSALEYGRVTLYVIWAFTDKWNRGHRVVILGLLLGAFFFYTQYSTPTIFLHYSKNTQVENFQCFEKYT